MKKRILFFLFIFPFYQCKAGFEYSSNLKKAFENILHLKFDDAQRFLDKETSEHPGNSLSLLYANYIDFLKAFITEEKKIADVLHANTDKRLQAIEQEKAQSPFRLVAEADMLIQSAMIHAKFSENVSAALDLHKAYRLAERNFILYPTFPLNKKSLGLLHAIVGAIPHEYRWLIGIAGMDGTIEQGSNELFRLLNETNQGIYPEYKVEVLFYLVQIYTSITSNDSITVLLADSVRKHAVDNPLMMYCYTNLTYKSGKNEDALQIINTFDDAGTFPFYFLHYKKAQLRLRKLDLKAEEDFRFFLSNFHGQNYIKSAYQKLAWISLLKNDEKKYQELIQECLAKGITLIDDDKEALKEAETKEVPNLQLLRSRLLFDGGYYKESFREIIKISSPSTLIYRDQLEYTYRYGRLFHKTGNKERAILNYAATIQNGVNSHYYFAANSALMLGLLYEEERDFKNSKKYFQLCLDMRHHDYQNSIDQKAQAGLERMKSNLQ